MMSHSRYKRYHLVWSHHDCYQQKKLWLLPSICFSFLNEIRSCWHRMIYNVLLSIYLLITINYKNEKGILAAFNISLWSRSFCQYVGEREDKGTFGTNESAENLLPKVNKPWWDFKSIHVGKGQISKLNFQTTFQNWT